MTLPVSGPISMSQMATEFSAPLSNVRLNDYYKGGPHVSIGNTASIPTSGTISLSQFYGVSNAIHYVTRDCGWNYWQADVGWSLDQFNGFLTLTLGYGSNVYHGAANANELVQLINPAVATTWSEVAQFKFAVANTIYFGTYGSGNLIKPSPFFGQPAFAIFGWDNTIFGQVPPGAAGPGYNRWFAAAKWNGLASGAGGAITVYFNPAQYGTGDTGWDITIGAYWTSTADGNGQRIGTSPNTTNSPQVPSPGWSQGFIGSFAIASGGTNVYVPPHLYFSGGYVFTANPSYTFNF